MEIEQVELDRLIPYARNPRKNDAAVDGVAASIKEFGFKQPIVIDSENVIVVGHTRAKAAYKLGLAKVPCLRAGDLSPDQIKAYRILDNKLAEKSDWDSELLAVELEGLDLDLEPFDVDFDIDLSEAFKGETSEDDYKAPDNLPTTVKRGDLIELGPHRLLCGDSANPKDVARLMNGKRSPLMISDPPYNVAGETDCFAKSCSAAMQKLSESEWDKDFNPIKFLEATKDHLAPSAWQYVFTAHHLFGHYVDWLNENRDNASWLVWCKPNPMPSLSKVVWTFAAELIVFARVGRPVFNATKGEHNLSWFPINKKTDGSHPTQKPVELIGHIIKHCSKPGAIVADYFLGSGTAVIACDQLNRICYGMEIAPHYCQVTIDRYHKHCETSGKEFACRINGRKYCG